MVRNTKVLGQRGQTTIEYVLLLAVIIGLASMVFKSRLFQDIFGRDSNFVAALIVQMEYAYRHGRMGEQDNNRNYQQHPTFYNRDEGKSRFFAPAEAYPKR